MESLGRVIYAEDDDDMYEMVGKKKLVTMVRDEQAHGKVHERQN